MLNEYFEKESIPEIRALGVPAFVRSLPGATGYGRASKQLKIGAETMPATEECLLALANGRDFMRLVDIPGMCDVIRKMGDRDTAKRIETGDDLAAIEIEKILSKIESHMLITTGSHVSDDVVGATPNVPAFLSGQPMNMRTRKSAKTGRGPISLFLETTTSSGFTGRDRIGRIAAMMALARALAVHRPLNLWFNITWGGTGRLTQTSVQIETNPIDMSRIAALCANLDNVNSAGGQDSRNNCANHCASTGNNWGSWAYGIPILERKFAGEILARVISPGSEVAYLPAGLMGTDDLTNPENWVERMLKKFAPYLFDGGEWQAA